MWKSADLQPPSQPPPVENCAAADSARQKLSASESSASSSSAEAIAATAPTSLDFTMIDLARLAVLVGLWRPSGPRSVRTPRGRRPWCRACGPGARRAASSKYTLVCSWRVTATLYSITLRNSPASSSPAQREHPRRRRRELCVRRAGARIAVARPRCLGLALRNRDAVRWIRNEEEPDPSFRKRANALEQAGSCGAPHRTTPRAIQYSNIIISNFFGVTQGLVPYGNTRIGWNCRWRNFGDAATST